ncbi:response regulator [Lutibacter sp. B1]|uniref:response regulator n=1 Tax=Lutibacter sp. B1 TaxID=2725996 RepID=UPI0014572DA7|nr:response regulator [Lutibacter sp. B1]NLP58657.1 response regulator [Lutibacter sp. B1]
MNLEILQIALVDDDEDDRFLFKEAIEDIEMNTNLSLFKNGKEFLDYIFKPDIILPELVFLDLNMPVINGIQCLTEIRKNNDLSALSVAIYSTSSSDKDIEDTFVKGANIYIKKPNDFNKLKNVLEKVLKINWQYFTSGLNKENFLLKI